MRVPSIGLLLPTRELLLADAASPEPLLSLARDAEAAGLASLWVGDGITNRPRLDPMVVLAALSSVTTTIALGTAVLLAPLRHPVILAHQCASLDWVTQGRLILGLGSGFPTPDSMRQSQHLGSAHDTRHERLADTVRFLRACWAEAPGREVTFRGATFEVEQLTLALRPARQAGPPFWLPGSGRASIRRVAELADGWLPYPVTAERYATQWSSITSLAAAANRPTPTAALYATVAIDDDVDRAHAGLDRALRNYYGWGIDVIGRVQAVRAGTADDVAAWLAGYAAAGADHVVVRFAGTDPRRGLDLLSSRVLPRLTTLLAER
jgi:alkanesulfonate monooxygenase SsuD/methylene tetrahydromethanopterin reductase-like flavin-dependent oxidoreductase (luciferase family)